MLAGEHRLLISSVREAVWHLWYDNERQCLKGMCVGGKSERSASAKCCFSARVHVFRINSVETLVFSTTLASPLPVVGSFPTSTDGGKVDPSLNESLHCTS